MSRQYVPKSGILRIGGRRYHVGFFAGYSVVVVPIQGTDSIRVFKWGESRDYDPEKTQTHSPEQEKPMARTARKTRPKGAHGWKIPGTSRTPHCFVGGQSLCLRYLDDGEGSLLAQWHVQGHCAECLAELKRRQEAR